MKRNAWWIASALVLATCSALGAQQPRPGQQNGPQEGNLQVGDMAPDFTLKSLEGKHEVTLSDFRGRKPVALIFGSYT